MHHKQAKAATLDKGVSRLCKAAGMATKIPADSPKPLFVVGDGQFGSKGAPIQHQRFIQSLKKKVVGLNGVIAYGDEYLTSRVCCQCKTQGDMFAWSTLYISLCLLLSFARGCWNRFTWFVVGGQYTVYSSEDLTSSTTSASSKPLTKSKTSMNRWTWP
ncbi:hypothetical protein BGX34_000182 [Mortierella sp. NVP85]|nr:hypothetical protein BGX34_000182 [Mortierella sp. NVP85]